jgi:hypothetical protein
MTKEPSSDRLDQYSRILILAGPAKARLYVSPILPEEESLFATIDALWQNLQRVEPDQAFKEQLHQQLMEEARRDVAKAHLGISKGPRRSRTPWIASAAALGAAATLAGAFAYWRWSTRQAA